MLARWLTLKFFVSFPFAFMAALISDLRSSSRLSGLNSGEATKFDPIVAAPLRFSEKENQKRISVDT